MSSSLVIKFKLPTPPLKVGIWQRDVVSRIKHISIISRPIVLLKMYYTERKNLIWFLDNHHLAMSGARCRLYHLKDICVAFLILLPVFSKHCFGNSFWKHFQGYLWMEASPSFLAPPELLPWEQLAEDQSWPIPEFWGVMNLLNLEQDCVYCIALSYTLNTL